MAAAPGSCRSARVLIVLFARAVGGLLMARIYISSTYADLADHRAAVARALRSAGHEVIAMEDYAAADQRPVDRCLDDVRRSDHYVGIVAFRYGYVPPTGAGLSITELEYRHAVESRKKCLIFLAAEDAGWPMSHSDFYSGDEITREKLKIFRGQLMDRHVVGIFTSADDLAAQVTSAVARADLHYSAVLAPLWNVLNHVLGSKRTAALERSVTPYYAELFVALGLPFLEWVWGVRKRRRLANLQRVLLDEDALRALRRLTLVAQTHASEEHVSAAGAVQKARSRRWGRAAKRLGSSQLAQAASSAAPDAAAP
jgi:hypothetical protein